MKNSKNDLQEIVQDLGYLETCISFSNTHHQASALFSSTAKLHLQGVAEITGTAEGPTKKGTEIAACQALINRIQKDHPYLLIDWEQVKEEAQIGDALLKLSAYLSEDIASAEEKSVWLQQNETDRYLAEVFDKLKVQGHEEVALFGPNLGIKRKATWMEALIWKKYGKKILSPSASQAFTEMNVFLKYE